MAHNWDDDAQLWEANPAHVEFNVAAFEQLVQLVNIEGKRILDLGCGTGLLSQQMAPFAKDIVALDSSEEMIEELDKKQLRNVEPVVDALSRGLVAQHPAFRGQFDLIVAASVCQFIEDLPTALTIARSLLEVDGWFVHWDWLDNQGMSAQAIEAALLDADFVDVRVMTPFDISLNGQARAVVMGLGRRR
ncbi:class I SAM-dependent DNA methyltransferase [Vibrio agarilyticus]|nr:methyltransferase domain-containing protein [Vibrio agarilyticus]